MSDNRGRTVFSLMLVLAATAFGMVLAGGSDLVPVSVAAPQIPSSGAVSVAVPGGMPSFADLADAVSPAVAFIEVVTIERQRRRDPLEFFFGPRRGPRGQDPNGDGPRRESSGSGFVISPDGLVVTNFHVIEQASEVRVHVNGDVYPAEVKGTDPATDLALLEIDRDQPLPYLALGDSEALRVGDWIMVIGSPLRLENSVSVGVVSAKGRSINITPDSSLENFIQTDAAINFGNSGGPLVDLDGRVVGIATAINYGAENIGFAVPVTTLERILPQLRDTGKVRRGYIGAIIADVDDVAARSFGLGEAQGVYVQSLVNGGPADRAGIEHGDVILKVNDRDIESTRILIDYVSGLPPGAKVEVEIFRDGKRVKKSVTLGERGIDGTGELDVGGDSDSEDRGQEIEWLGLQYQDLTDGVRQNHNLADDVAGVIVTGVSASSPLVDQNVAPGDIIAEVNGTRIDGVETFESAVSGVPSGGALRFYVRRIELRTGEQTAAFFAFVEVP